jgi:predicted nucleotidyltransferase
MTRAEFFDRIGTHRLELAQAGVCRLGVFGSVARNEAGPESDVDILVEFEGVPNLLEFAALRERLTEILGRPVDFTTPRALRQHLRSRVLDEVRYAAWRRTCRDEKFGQCAI